MTFPYVDGEPMVKLEMEARSGEWLEFMAYVDSGASYSVFYSDHARVLGIALKTGKSMRLMVGDGTTITVYLHKVKVKFAGKEFVAEVSFSDDLKIGMNLLGQRTYFENFTFCFKTWDNILEVISK